LACPARTTLAANSAAAAVEFGTANVALPLMLNGPIAKADCLLNA
jgi:hypothetical protein